MTNEPKPWRDMTDAEKGALLLAHHEGKEIEIYNGSDWFPTNTWNSIMWKPNRCYRVRPKPKRTTLKLYMGTDLALRHIGTIDVVEGGEPDFTTIKPKEPVVGKAC